VPPHPSHPTRLPDHRTGPETPGAAPPAGPEAPPHPHQEHGTPPETRGAWDTPRLAQARPHAGPEAQRAPRTAESVANAPPPPQAMGSCTAHWPHPLPRAPAAVCPLGPCGGYRLGARHAAHETPCQWATRSHRPPVRWTGAPRAGGAPRHRVAPTQRRGPQTSGGSGTPGRATRRQQTAAPAAPVLPSGDGARVGGCGSCTRWAGGRLGFAHGSSGFLFPGRSPERQGSGAPGSGSGADAVGRRLHPLVGPSRA